MIYKGFPNISGLGHYIIKLYNVQPINKIVRRMCKRQKHVTRVSMQRWSVAGAVQLDDAASFLLRKNI